DYYCQTWTTGIDVF
nr:immunoglobulin light chain junction region [Macaca mulatta]MOY15015.1 immunoglobulin light chain junction region [Macaca mulatta]MOY15201.1 immunoglobulin light chain junction region [Macaca mulatta]MOY15308.1 immunoglobulin light chain junction region [Macaca mulatta]MOY15495.1 immunoglobulin light chain junction region [Macaca mulatta]